MTSGTLPKTLRTIQIQLLMSPGGRYIKLSSGKDVININQGKSKLETGMQDGDMYLQAMWVQINTADRNQSFTSLRQYLFLLANALMFANCRSNSGDYNKKKSQQNNAEVLRLT